MSVSGRSARFSQVLTLTGLLTGFCVDQALAQEMMPHAQQTALVQKYCAVCHTDASNNGGLSLQHFDAAHAAPSLKAMLLSKLTSGISMQTAREAHGGGSAAALVNGKMKGGAMGAAGIPIPDKATVDALIHAFAMASTEATAWTVQRVEGQGVEASILREVPLAGSGEARAYRLITSCQPATRAGRVQLAWSPVPRNATFSVSSDGAAAVPFEVGGRESMGNGSGVVTNGLAALDLIDSRRGNGQLSFPSDTLTVASLFPDETVVFPFSTLPSDARRDLRACFSGPLGSTR